MIDKDLLYRFFEGQASLEEIKKIKEWTELSDENRALLHRERRWFDAMQIVTVPSGQRANVILPDETQSY